jgi:hypothetical protein
MELMVARNFLDLLVMMYARHTTIRAAEGGEAPRIDHCETGHSDERLDAAA